MALPVRETGQAIISPLSSLWNSFVDAFPGLIASLVVIVIGYFVGVVIGYLISRVLEGAGVDRWIKKQKLQDSIGQLKLSKLFGTICKWYVFAVFLAPAAGLLKLGSLSNLFLGFAQWFPNLIIALVIILFGLILADLAKKKMDLMKSNGVHAVSNIVKYVIILFFALVSLDQIGVSIVIAENLLTILFAGVALGLAIAFGLGFGQAIKDEAKGWIKNWKK